MLHTCEWHKSNFGKDRIMVSVVMSCYNAENTIRKAIDSVLGQSYKDLEVVVVNDCSTDGSEAIVRSIIEKDDRVRLVSHDKNMGAGFARRTAIENIRGEYMTFCDADDYLKSDCLERMINAAKRYNADIVAGGLLIVDQDGNILEERVPDRVIQVDGAKFKRNEADTKRFMCTMLIRSSLWNNVEYSSRRFIEDTPTLVQILYWARNIMMIDYAGYYYVQNPSSLTHATSIVKYLVYRALCVKDMSEFFRSVGMHHLADDASFIAAYEGALDRSTEKERLAYKTQIDELNEYYKSIKR